MFRIDAVDQLEAAQLRALADFSEGGMIELDDVVVSEERAMTRGASALIFAYAARYIHLDRINVGHAAISLKACISRGEQLGAAPLLLAEIDDWLSPRPGFTVDRRLVEMSIDAEPDWSLNWFQLAWDEESRGEISAAISHLLTGLANLLPQDVQLSPLQRAVETLFSGRLSHPSGVEQRLDALRSNLKA